MTALIIIVSWVVLFLVLSESVGVLVLGRFLSDKEMTPFFEKHMHEYIRNGMSEDGHMFYGLTAKPYIAAMWGRVSSKWYINDYGQIPRWSKWHKTLNELQKELKPKKMPKKLSDL
jgi:hypothetical protein